MLSAKLKKMSAAFTQILFTLLAIYLTYLLLRYPAQALTFASTGLILWFRKMIPTLIPFMILSGIMIRMNLTERFAKFFHPVFHKIWGTSLNGSYALLMGMLCGFPMGARVVGELCQAGKLSEDEGAYLLAFCNNIGPIYFLSFVMSTLSLSGNYLPFLIMYGVPLAYGCLLRIARLFKPALFRFVRHFRHNSFRYGQIPSGSLPLRAMQVSPTQIASVQTPPLLSAVDDAVVSGLIGIAKLGGYMVFFNLLNILIVPFSHLPDGFLSFCNCILEITSGISRTGADGKILILILLPFGGLSCISQTYSMIRDTNLSILHYFLHKCIQTAITALIYAFFYAASYNFLK